MQGVVTRYGKAKYFGFIRIDAPDGWYRDFFFHNDDVLSPSISEGDLVDFILDEGSRGRDLQATRVLVLERMQEPLLGTVKFFLPDKFFGFVIEDGPEAKEYFVHGKSVTAGPIEKGMRVKFLPLHVAGDRGPSAVCVERAKV